MTFKLFNWDSAWFEHADALKQIAPDWETELQKAIMPKPTFLALTMGCKENVISLVKPMTGVTETGQSIVREAYRKRSSIISSNFPDGPFFDGKQYSSSDILLKKATQFVYDLGWKLPKPMLKLISPPLKRNKARSTKGPELHSPSLAAFGFQSDYLDEMIVLINRYFKDKEGNPITDPSKWPLKKNIESEILHGRLLDAVDTLITSRRRRGNRKV